MRSQDFCDSRRFQPLISSAPLGASCSGGTMPLKRMQTVSSMLAEKGVKVRQSLTLKARGLEVIVGE